MAAEPKVIRSPAAMFQWSEEVRRQNKTIGFVPTLGNLHRGHGYLMRALRDRCDLLVVSIFINPTQFAANEDYANYPRTEEEDKRICAAEKVDLIFIPAAEDIYVKLPLTKIDVPTMTGLHCGMSRPSHFSGVLMIVNLFLNIVVPHWMALGKKDFQQLRVIEIMVQELHIPVELVAVDTGRERDGLALSSRNRYLTQDQRPRAPQLYAVLSQLKSAIEKGERNYRLLEEQASHLLGAAKMKVDYVHISRSDDLQPAEKVDKELVILAAVYLGKARLIDNVRISL